MENKYEFTINRLERMRLEKVAQKQKYTDLIRSIEAQYGSEAVKMIESMKLREMQQSAFEDSLALENACIGYVYSSDLECAIDYLKGLEDRLEKKLRDLKETHCLDDGKAVSKQMDIREWSHRRDEEIGLKNIIDKIYDVVCYLKQEEE